MARFAIQPVASVSAGPPWGGLYLKPPSRGGLWLGVTTMPSARFGSSGASPRLWRRMAWLTRGRRNPVVELVDERLHTVGDQHFERRGLGRAGEPVRVLADEERAPDALSGPVLGDRLGGGRDVGVVERRVERGPAMAARAEHDPLLGDRGIRHLLVVRLDEHRVHVDEIA